MRDTPLGVAFSEVVFFSADAVDAGLFLKFEQFLAEAVKLPGDPVMTALVLSKEMQIFQAFQVFFMIPPPLPYLQNLQIPCHYFVQRNPADMPLT